MVINLITIHLVREEWGGVNKISIHPLTSFAEDIRLTKLGSASCCIRTTARLNTVVIAVS